MIRNLVVILVGKDRPGIVESLAQTVVEHQGTWEESRMANLGGQFAGILRVGVDEGNLPALTEALQSVEDLQVTLVPTEEVEAVERLYCLRLLGQDRPGIVHRISADLARIGASVDDMETEVLDASMSGEKLFKARIALRLPEGVSADTLREQLETIADELIVDIELD